MATAEERDVAGTNVRVLYSFPHPLGGPGINTTAWQQVAALASLGVPVVVYCTSLREPLPADVPVVQTMRIAGHRLPHRAIGVNNAYAYHDARVANAIRRMSGRIDVVHCWPSSCLQTIRSARRHGVASFREVPSAHTESTFAASAHANAATGIELPKGYATRFDARRLRREEVEFKRADFLLVPSDYVADTFIERGTPPDKMLKHRYGYDPKRFNPSARADDGRPFTGVFVGRGEPAKGLHLALRAWLDSPAAESGRFLIAGKIVPAYERYLGTMLAHPSVEALGFVSDMGAVFRSSDVLIFPTFTEGSALVTYEAMASGVVPLVSTSAGAPIHDGIDGLLHRTEDVSTLTTQIARLYDDPGLLSSMRTEAIASSSGLTWLAAGERVLSAYQEGLDRLTHRTPS